MLCAPPLLFWFSRERSIHCYYSVLFWPQTKASEVSTWQKFPPRDRSMQCSMGNTGPLNLQIHTRTNNLILALQKMLIHTKQNFFKFSFFMFNTTTHWWWHNQSAVPSVHSKTINYERWCLLQWFIPIYLHTAIVDIVYWQYNWNFWPQNSIPWLRIFLTWSVYLICIANYSKVKLQVDHLFLKG